jgi:long-chain acyl-CoA synthetase
VVLKHEYEPELSGAERRVRFEQHYQGISQSLPFWKRVKGIEFLDDPLPRTAKKSVKRRDVVRLIQERVAATQPAGTAPRDGDAAWFINIVATVTGKPASDISLSTRVDLLGFDSLMYSELSAALDADGAGISPDVDFTGAPDVASLFEIVRANRGAHSGARKSSVRNGKAIEVVGEKKEIQVPDPIVRVGRTGLRLGQNAFYKAILKTEVKGFAHVPRNESFIVAANHTSHLDMGALKVALGEAGRGLASLAAADYFFSTRWRRAWFENFTNLVAMERAGSVRKSLDIAEDVLRSGKSMVVFPEGTRSRTGVMKEFLPSIGYLALRSGVGVLPAYIEGAHASLPVGKSVPRSRDLKVVFGPFLSIDMLRAATDGMSQQEAWAHAALLVERVVTGLRDHKPFPVDPESLRNVTREARS